MSRFLITGVSGFIGSSLADYLIEKGHDILGIDNLITGKKENIQHLFSNPKFTFYERDVLEFNTNGYLKADGIFYLASPTAPKECKKNPIQTLETNCAGLLTFLELARSQNIPLLYTSSVRILDDGIEDVYSQAKRVGELLAKEYSVKIARLGNIIGPRLDDSRVFPSFLRKALNNEELIIWGGGDQEDSFLYIDDILDGLHRFINSDYNGVIEFGSDEHVTINELATMIIKVCQSKSEVKHEDYKISSGRKLADTRLAKTLLRWEPKVKLEDGIMRCLLHR